MAAKIEIPVDVKTVISSVVAASKQNEVHDMIIQMDFEMHDYAFTVGVIAALVGSLKEDEPEMNEKELLGDIYNTLNL